jgi:integrase
MNEQKTLGEFLDDWLETVIRGNVRQSTYAAYRGYVENHIKPNIGVEILAELSAERLQRFVAKLCGKSLAIKTVRSVFLMLRSALKCAVDYGYMDKNSCDRVRMPKLVERESTAISKTAQRRLEEAVINSGDTRHIGILICLYTGLRIGEVCGLKWDYVDFARKQLVVKVSLNRVACYDCGEKKTILAETEPKTKKSRRTIPLPEFLLRLLRDLKEKQKSEKRELRTDMGRKLKRGSGKYEVRADSGKELKSGSGYVISMKSGKPVEPRLMQILYKKLLQSAGIEYVSFHTLRHTFATRAIEAGADVKTLSEVLGHSNTMITVNRYTHSLYEQKRKMMREFDRLHQKLNE